ncbi:MAG: hypothetical protein NTV97_33560 [Alphaproteobacteria bacterium]|nr:hypothetical protein [Alphaproteobacteria bacterium]
MGNGLSGAAVFRNVHGLNHLFRADVFNARVGGTRAVIKSVRDSMYPNLLSHDKPKKLRQGSLWFAASVLTPHLKLDYDHPATTHRRWIKWLIWLQKAQPTEHNYIIDAINAIIDEKETVARKPAIHFTWTESSTFSVNISSPDASGLRIITVTSIRGDMSEIDKLVREDEEGGDDEDDEPQTPPSRSGSGKPRPSRRKAA